MLTETENTLTILDDIEEVDYPPDVIARWIKIGEETKAQLAAGEIFPMTEEEFEAEVIRRRNHR